MNKDIERKVIAILEILNSSHEPVGATYISNKLLEKGINLSERGVRYHLRIMDERGLTKVIGKEGRVITNKGREELNNALVADKIGFIISKISSLAFRTSLNIDTGKGDVILNISYIPRGKLKKALNIMKEVFNKGYGISDRIIVFEKEDEEIFPGIIVPEKEVIIGTVCSVTIHGILIKQGIPVEAKFAGILEIKDRNPTRFLEIITYEGTTLDPLEIFIRSKMTSILSAVKNGSGKILATLREIPSIALSKVEEVLKEIRKIGFQGNILLGRPNQEILGIPVASEKVGLVIAGGLNPLAAVEEAGIEARNKAMGILYEYSKLIPIKEFLS
ncbi:MAG: NrpR regulatory domain-containing protein [Dictyoglomus sp.]|nr:NrpR regulatory domain-containing protein [Dictyoglomus sp.]MCX7941571.1 NrpR regulatory domain-containing protein [Dictyoglomaceae bacterium]MDW8187810.1 NrpR regulatory domain-containing protein [Dictyoglomus sp.]